MLATPALVRFSRWSWWPVGRTVPSLCELTLTVSVGERLLLLGPSGAGKSTLLAAIAGLLELEDGHASGEREHAGIASRSTPLASGQHGVGLVLQDPESQVVLDRVEAELGFGAENQGLDVSTINARVSQAAEAVGLARLLDGSTEALSGGQKQRLALGSVLAMRPALLLLDEPTANLDARGSTLIRQYVVDRLRADTELAMVVVDHDWLGWLDAVDRVVVLDATGRLVLDERPQCLLECHRAVLEDLGVWHERTVRSEPGSPPQPVGESAPAILTAHRLVAGYRGVAATRPIDLEVRPGEVVALRGDNGAGKSSVLKTLAGLAQPVAGEVMLAGRVPYRLSARELSQWVAIALQHPEAQFVKASVVEELGSDNPEVLGRIGLAEAAKEHPLALSGGQKRRLSVASAVMRDTPLILLDEPSFGQDGTTWSGVVEIIREASKRGAAVVMATHDAALVRALGARELWLTGPTTLPDAPGPEPVIRNQPAAEPFADPPAKATQTPRQAQPWPARLNPLAVCAGVILSEVVAVASFDLATAVVTAGLWLGIIIGSSLARDLLRPLALVIWIAAPVGALGAALYGRVSGETIWQFGLIHLSTGSIHLALVSVIRTIAFGVPAVVLFRYLDPVRIAAALAQNLGVSPRFVLGGLAALRQVESIRELWRDAVAARRARGELDAQGLVSRARLTLTTLAFALRRGADIARAMHSRGVENGIARTWRIRVPWRKQDTGFVVVGGFIALAALAVSLATGQWRGAWA